MCHRDLPRLVDPLHNSPNRTDISIQDKDHGKLFSAQTVLKPLFILYSRYDRVRLDRVQKFFVHILSSSAIFTQYHPISAHCLKISFLLYQFIASKTRSIYHIYVLKEGKSLWTSLLQIHYFSNGNLNCVSPNSSRSPINSF